MYGILHRNPNEQNFEKDSDEEVFYICIQGPYDRLLYLGINHIGQELDFLLRK